MIRTGGLSRDHQQEWMGHLVKELPKICSQLKPVAGQDTWSTGEHEPVETSVETLSVASLKTFSVYWFSDYIHNSK